MLKIVIHVILSAFVLVLSLLFITLLVLDGGKYGVFLSGTFSILLILLMRLQIRDIRNSLREYYSPQAVSYRKFKKAFDHYLNNRADSKAIKEYEKALNDLIEKNSENNS